MILHSYVEQVMMMCQYRSDNSHFHSFFPLIVSDTILCPLHNLNTICNIILILYSYVEHVMMMSRTSMATLAFILFELFPLDCF